METINQAQNSTDNQKDNSNNFKLNLKELPIKFTPALKISLIFLVVIIILLLLALILIPRQITQAQPTPTLISPTTNPTIINRTESEFSKTEQFKNFENKFETLIKEHSEIDLNETKLTFPLLEMNVNYQRQ